MNERSYYTPKTFYINFRCGVLDKNGLPKYSELPTFLHEIAHLVQDQSTISGAKDFVFFLDRIQDLRRLIRSGVNTLPLRSHVKAKSTWSAVLDELEPIQYASKPWPEKPVAWAFENYRIDNVTRTQRGKTCKYSKAIGCFVDNVSYNTLEQPIGTRDIKEAYAVAVERLQGRYEPDLFSPEFQYVAIERILSQFGEVSPRKIIAICHWALQDTFPGLRFFELFDELKRQNFDPMKESDEKWFDILRDCSSTGFSIMRQQVRQCLGKYIKHYGKGSDKDPLFLTLKWYKKVLEKRFDEIECTSRRFPIDTFIGQKHVKWNSNTFVDLQSFLEEHPLPQIEDGDGNLFCYGESKVAVDGVFILRAMFHAYEKIWSGSGKNWGCPFFETCPPVKIPQKDSSCKQQARLKGSIKPFCPYGAGAFYIDAHII